MAVSGVRWEGMVQNRSAHRPAAQRYSPLLLLHAGRAHAPGVLLFLMLLENYGFQLHHLTPHAIILVAIFAHFCEMYVGIWSSVRLFWLFFTL
jgi:hypothetical protein